MKLLASAKRRSHFFFRYRKALSLSKSPGRVSTPQPQDTIIKLNIGGYKYETTKSTLTSHGPSFFTLLLSGNIPSTQDDKGYYFIDRDGKYFEPILEFLRTGELVIPQHFTRKAVQREADFYAISLPPEKKSISDSGEMIQNGIFISTKYGVNELVIFGPKNKGCVIRGAWSKAEFYYKIRGGSRVEIEWESQQPKSNLWFLSGNALITSSVNEYTFFQQVPPPSHGAIYQNTTDPIKIFDDGRIFGFRFLAPEELKNDEPKNLIVCDVRNQWELCTFEMSRFCYDIDSILITYTSKETVRYKSYFSYSHDFVYEDCDETFTVEMICFGEFVLARLVTYKLVVKRDKSILPIGHSRSFHQYVLKHG